VDYAQRSEGQAKQRGLQAHLHSRMNRAFMKLRNRGRKRTFF
jgi:hypothetical protein